MRAHVFNPSLSVREGIAPRCVVCGLPQLHSVHKHGTRLLTPTRKKRR